MANIAWTGVLNQGTAWSGAGAALNTAATAAISPQFGNRDFPIQGGGQPYGWYVSQLIRVTARGYLTTTSTSTTATFLIRANLNNANSTLTTLATTNGITTGTTVLSGVQWKMEALIRCTAIAATGNTVSCQGEIGLQGLLASGAALAANPQALTTGVSIGASFPMPAATGETASAVDTSQLQGLQFAATLAGANATIQLTQWVIEGLN